MSFSFLEETALQYWAQLDCPTSLSLTILARAGQWAEVLAFRVEPEYFADAESYARANMAVCFLKKNPVIPGFSDEDRLRACHNSWRIGEASCYQANERLSPFLIHSEMSSMPAQLLRRARAILLNWLGPCPDDNDNSLFYDGAELKRSVPTRKGLVDVARHGPGTTFSSSVANPTAADKFDEVMSLTRNASFYLWNVAGTKWMEALHERSVRTGVALRDCINYSRGNRFAAVPKTAMTHRGIAIECTLNVYFQLAIGRAIRQSLRRRAGWDLDNAAGVHRKMAQAASIDGSWATIDLSNASDSLCKNLVRILLHGTPWLERMEDLRSTHTFFDKKWHLLEKFSSMGNGYTFELETCVFACLISATLELNGSSGVLGHDLFVFGDDIIVRTEYARSVVAVLGWAGFKVNKEKTFTKGSFRESCGGDFFLGQPVRAFYLKQDLAYGTQTVYTLHNGARSSLENVGDFSPWFLDWVRKRLLPVPLRHIGGPNRFGDSVLHGVEAKYRWDRFGIRWVKTVRWYEPRLLRWKFWSDTVRLACRLTGTGDTFGIYSRGHSPAEGFSWVSDS
jgi:hypothetical protein